MIPLRRAWCAWAFVAAGCGEPAPPPEAEVARAAVEPAEGATAPRIVLLYATCSLNRDYTAAYDPSVPFTPHLAALARESAVFEDHWTETGLSGTDFASILTGTHAERHGVYKHPRELAQGVELVFEAFARAGWETFHWAEHGMAAPKYGYSEGVAPKNRFRERMAADDRRLQRLLGALAREPERRALLATTFTLTHSPYSLETLDELLADHPERARGLARAEIERLHALYAEHFVPLQTRHAETLAALGLAPDEVERLAQVVELAYEASVHHLDRELGALLALLDEHDLADETLLVFTADHGETLQRAQRLFPWTHSPELAPETLRPPLVVRGPGVRAGRIRGVTRSIDLFPTVAGLAGVPVAPGTVQGVDLSAALRGTGELPALAAPVHGTLRQWSFFTPDLIENVRVGKKEGPFYFRWSRAGDAWEFEVLELASDEPDRDRFDPDDPLHAAAAAELWAYRQRQIEAFRRFFPKEAQSRAEELGHLGEEELRALSALGYIESDH
jgi:arylsulfatase A-like enzyme